MRIWQLELSKTWDSDRFCFLVGVSWAPCAYRGASRLWPSSRIATGPLRKPELISLSLQKCLSPATVQETRASYHKPERRRERAHDLPVMYAWLLSRTLLVS